MIAAALEAIQALLSRSVDKHSAPEVLRQGTLRISTGGREGKGKGKRNATPSERHIKICQFENRVHVSQSGFASPVAPVAPSVKLKARQEASMDPRQLDRHPTNTCINARACGCMSDCLSCNVYFSASASASVCASTSVCASASVCAFNSTSAPSPSPQLQPPSPASPPP